MRVVKWRFLVPELRMAVTPLYPAPFEKFNQPHLNLPVLLHPVFTEHFHIFNSASHIAPCSLFSPSSAGPATSDLAQQSHLLGSLSLQFPGLYHRPTESKIIDTVCHQTCFCYLEAGLALQFLWGICFVFFHYYDPIY